MLLATRITLLPLSQVVLCQMNSPSTLQPREIPLMTALLEPSALFLPHSVLFDAAHERWFVINAHAWQGREVGEVRVLSAEGLENAWLGLPRVPHVVRGHVRQPRLVHFVVGGGHGRPEARGIVGFYRSSGVVRAGGAAVGSGVEKAQFLGLVTPCVIDTQRVALGPN